MKKKYHRNLTNWVKKHKNQVRILGGGSIVVVISMVLTRTVQLSMTAQQNIEKYTILKEMIAADDIGHKRGMILETMTGYNKERGELFNQTDYKYHKAQEMEEKYQAAKKLLLLIKEQCKFLEQINYEHTDDRNKIIKIEQEINQIQLE